MFTPRGRHEETNQFDLTEDPLRSDLPLSGESWRSGGRQASEVALWSTGTLIRYGGTMMRYTGASGSSSRQVALNGNDNLQALSAV